MALKIYYNLLRRYCLFHLLYGDTLTPTQRLFTEILWTSCLLAEWRARGRIG